MDKLTTASPQTGRSHVQVSQVRGGDQQPPPPASGRAAAQTAKITVVDAEFVDEDETKK